MKSWLICVVFISMLVVGPGVAAEKKYLQFLDPCNQPNPPPTCSEVKEQVEANPYNRGCSAIHRCRGG
ncbi:protein RALF-like 11 [Benincasa hispida]|uniref:protein RALF-like 11 n=1 Tax=Benincasa hispida TaxID=102211 RepID=UPI0018FF9862|nr:protein RALF-like 11 [Benincasa hispida]